MSAKIIGNTITFHVHHVNNEASRIRSSLQRLGFSSNVVEKSVVFTSPQGWTFEQKYGLRGRQIVTFIDESGVSRGKYEYEDGACDDFGGICLLSLI